jgi:tetratricopeptide (TPR) repeat protein
MTTPRRRGIAYPLRLAAIGLGLIVLSVFVPYLILAPAASPPSSGVHGSAEDATVEREAPSRPEVMVVRTDAFDRVPVTPAEAEEETVAAPAEADGPLKRARAHLGDERWSEALVLYDSLHAASPGDVELAVERAEVLAWAGRHREAAAALEKVLRTHGTAEVHLDRARYFWWAGDAEAADEALDAALAIAPGDTAARQLRSEVRRVMLPDVETGRRWAADGGSEERLALARALVREDRHAEALPHFRTAIAAGAGADSVILELASAAASADSLGAAAAALSAYLERHPGDRDVRIRLARTLAWDGRPDEAIAVYTTLLRQEDDPGLRFARAQLYAWGGDHELAERDLQQVLERSPAHAEALALRGDLASWSGDHARAAALYRRAAASDPDLEGIAEREHLATERQLAALARGSSQVGPGGWTAEARLFANSDGFRRIGSQATRGWATELGTLDVTVRQELTGDQAFPTSSAGAGADADLTVPLSGRLDGRLHLGLHGYGAARPIPSWGVGAGVTTEAGMSLSADYRREVGNRQMETLGSLDAEVMADNLRVSLGGSVGDWSIWSGAQWTRLSSELAATERISGSASASTFLTPSFRGTLGIWMLATDGVSPTVPGAGSLFWSPRYYINPTFELAHQRRLGERWGMEMHMRPGYAIVSEGDEGERRFTSGNTPTLRGGVDLFRAGALWDVTLSADLSGAARSDYTSGSIGVRINRRRETP